nr:hypothetical protein Iba_chr08bCG9020 [Ipomoea batatas]
MAVSSSQHSVLYHKRSSQPNHLKCLREFIQSLRVPVLHNPTGNDHRILCIFFCPFSLMVVHNSHHIFFCNNLHSWLSTNHTIPPLTRSIKTRLHRLEQEAGRIPVIFLHQTSVSKHRSQVIREN